MSDTDVGAERLPLDEVWSEHYLVKSIFTLTDAGWELFMQIFYFQASNQTYSSYFFFMSLPRVAMNSLVKKCVFHFWSIPSVENITVYTLLKTSSACGFVKKTY